MALRADHEYPDALASLSYPTEATPGGLSRRRFLAGLGGAGVLAALGGTAALRTPRANAQSATRNLVVLALGGGNDGYATIMPTTAGPLDQLRPGLLSPKAQLLALGDGYGFHPSLPRLHSMFQSGQVAVVGGVGSFGRLSHFEAMGDWMAGTSAMGSGPPAIGWLGRWLDTLGPEEPLRATSLTGQVPVMLVGNTTAGTGIGLSGSGLLGSQRRNVSETALFSMIEGWGDGAGTTTGRQHAARVGATASTLAARIGPVLTPATPTEYGAAQMTVAARLLNDATLGCQVVFCTLGGFDLHTNEAVGQSIILGQVDRAVAAFFDTLSPTVASRTTVLVFSEFGRRPGVNGANGTDHGTANYAFLLGPPVRGGLVGSHLKTTQLDSRGNPAAPVRHTDVIGTVLGRWLGADASAIVGGSTTTLNLFR